MLISKKRWKMRLTDKGAVMKEGTVLWVRKSVIDEELPIGVIMGAGNYVYWLSVDK